MTLDTTLVPALHSAYTHIPTCILRVHCTHKAKKPFLFPHYLCMADKTLFNLNKISGLGAGQRELGRLSRSAVGHTVPLLSRH